VDIRVDVYLDVPVCKDTLLEREWLWAVGLVPLSTT
jgi:hypothetical protein